MKDDLELLKALRQDEAHRPSDDLRRAVRIAALERLATPRRRRVWDVLLDQLAIPMALAAVSVVYLVWAAGHTPLLLR
jgi:hypothetical protein